MTNERYIAAVEISSSKIIGAIGKTTGNGDLDIIALEEEKGVESVRYGIIQNLEETSTRLARVLDRLQRQPGVAPRRISRLFVGLSGRSVRSITSEVSLRLPAETEITDEIVGRLREEALKKAIDSSLEVVDAVPGVFTVGNTVTRTPKGLVGDMIKGSFDLIVCRPELKRNLVRTITEKVGIPIEGFVVTALATAHLILKPDDKRLGCMLVDMGAETTTVSIYKDASLRYFATLPLGGRNITRDLTSLNLLEERAEEIKTVSGNAIMINPLSSLNLNGIKLQDVSNRIVARSEEIVANVTEQMVYAGIKENELGAGIMVVGGGARLNGMRDLLANQSNMRVVRGTLPDYVHVQDQVRGSALEHIQVASIAYAGATLSQAQCLEEEERRELPATGPSPSPSEAQQGGAERHSRDIDPEPAPEPPRPKRPNRFLEGIKSRLANFFSPIEDSDDESDLLD